MNQELIHNIKSQMRKGMLEYCMLLMLSRAKLYPSDIIRRLEAASMEVMEGTIYTLLNRLRREGKLDYEWQESTQGPPRKYYFATPYGLEVLGAMSEAWRELNATVVHLEQGDDIAPAEASAEVTAEIAAEVAEVNAEVAAEVAEVMAEVAAEADQDISIKNS